MRDAIPVAVRKTPAKTANAEASNAGISILSKLTPKFFDKRDTTIDEESEDTVTSLEKQQPRRSSGAIPRRQASLNKPGRTSSTSSSGSTRERHSVGSASAANLDPDPESKRRSSSDPAGQVKGVPRMRKASHIGRVWLSELTGTRQLNKKTQLPRITGYSDSRSKGCEYN